MLGRPTFVACAVAAWLTGCGGGGPGGDAALPEGGTDGTPGDATPADAPAGPAIELGTGTAAFEAIPTTGDPEIPLIRGPQGGWHLNGSVRLFALDPDGLVLSYRTTDPGDGTVLSFPLSVELSARRVMPEGDHLVRLGDRVIFMIFDPSEVEGRIVDLSVTATPASGTALTDTRRVTVGMETLPSGT